MANQSSIEIAVRKDSPARFVCARESIESRRSLGRGRSLRRRAGWIDLAGLLPVKDRLSGSPDVLNGIAWDAAGRRLFVTGKLWPKLFEIRLVRKGGPAH